MILINLQKVLKTINHDILLIKLSIIGFRYNEKYLSNRKSLVNLEKPFSENSSTLCSVTQGAILNPLLFLNYVKDMLMTVKCNLFLYADDTCLVFQLIMSKISKSC